MIVLLAFNVLVNTSKPHLKSKFQQNKTLYSIDTLLFTGFCFCFETLYRFRLHYSIGLILNKKKIQNKTNTSLTTDYQTTKHLQSVL